MVSLGRCILGLWFGCKDQASFGTNTNFEVDSMACPRAFRGRGCDSPNIKENPINNNVNKDTPCTISSSGATFILKVDNSKIQNAFEYFKCSGLIDDDEEIQDMFEELSFEDTITHLETMEEDNEIQVLVH